MKKILSASLLFFSLSVHAQTDSTNASADTSQIKFFEPPDSTGFGTPDGQLVSKEIGPAGGTIASDDGKVELFFPPDALTANTNISIQPITNLAPNGAGKAYQFEPSGIQFKKPVQIIFHYTDKEAKSCPPELMGLVIQDDTGKWSFFDYDGWDSTAKVLKGSIEHFSRGSNSYKFQLHPDKRLLRVDEETQVSVSGTYKKFRKSTSRALTPTELSTLFYRWHAAAGIIQNPTGNSCTYKAPSTMPTPNPVTIKVTTSIGVSAECDIEIYDGYEIKVSGEWSHKPADQDDVEIEITESSSFTLDLQTTDAGTKWKTDNIKNDPPAVKIVKCPKECKCKLIDNHCTGMIEIGGVTDVIVSGDAVTIDFEKVQASFPVLESKCKTRVIPFTPKAPAVPSKMVFTMKEGKQDVVFDFGDRVIPIKYTFTIERKKN